MGKIAALTGGVGGAKLVSGLSQILPATDLEVVVNTGDDFDHLGLSISPDIDTLIYTLAGLNDNDRGWGRANETWSFMSTLQDLGAETWFRLGDKDLALNIFRTQQLRKDLSLSEVTRDIANRLGVPNRVIPMSDDPVRTIVKTATREIEFQDYFVRHKCEPVVQSIHYHGADRANPAPRFQHLLSSDDIEAFVICPSNPYLSIDPILSIPGVVHALRENPAPVIAISPLVGRNSLKGPTAKLMAELGFERSAVAVAQHYRGLIDTLVLDAQDQDLASDIESLRISAVTANIIMHNGNERRALAEFVFSLAGSS